MKCRKSKLFIVLAIMLFLLFIQISFFISEVNAEVITGSEGNVSWSFDSENGTLTFSGSGSISNAWKDDISSYQTSVKSIKITSSGITKIGYNAFSSCDSITSIEIPNSVTSIGDSAFAVCDSLTNIEIPDSIISIENGAFWCCTNLTDIKIPNSVTSIGVEAFYGCNSLTSIEIPNSVTKIGRSAFEDCKNLTSIIVENSNLNYRDIDGVLFDKKGSTLIQYPCGKDNKSYVIPDGVTNIGEGAFVLCESLTSIEIPNSVTSIGAFAFYGCRGITSIAISDNITSIGTNAFDWCDSLTSITVENSNLNYKDIDGVLFDKNGTILIQYPSQKKDASYVIPNSVTKIGDSAFYNCNNLTSIEIPNSVTSIEKFAFVNCEGLTSIEIPNNVTCIEEGAFYSCNKLTSIIIPNNVTNMGRSIFAWCYNLTIYVTSNSCAKTYAEDNNIPYIVEDIAPTIEASYKDGIITITAVDEGVGLANEKYSLDNKNWCASNEFLVNKSGKYTVYARDKLGNIATKEIDIIVEEKDVVDEDKNNETGDNQITNNGDNEVTFEENKEPTNKDETKSPKPFGKFGDKSFIVLLIVITLISLTIYIKYKKYNFKY